ncbi:MAG: 23S rRNA (adenine(2503)-C(2))-methyltransferase RlmN [Elusimicrobia bacterium]|nr:23S rRNA (adenine(2503)-C(2))-methyltransferase RlmN [Elusimicrobiota bacterium]
MHPKKIAEFIQQAGLPAYRTGQILNALCGGAAGFDKITTLPAALREQLSKEFPILSFQVEKVLSSTQQDTHKARLKLADGKMIETVLMQPKPGLWSVCVSSQAGCALGCTFCATGLMGFIRNLTPEEITDQVLFWIQYLRKHSALSTQHSALSNIVYMGMGEPMLNFDNVKESIAWLTNPALYGFGHRSISVSTAGVVPGIDRFTTEMSQVNLALSLHAANNELRSRLVPINRAHDLNALAKSLKRYFAKNNRKVFLEYVLLAGENDSLAHAQELVTFCRRIGFPHLLHVNLIVWNPTDTPHHPSSREAASEFKALLINRHISVTIRKNLGQDIAGACGQLVVGNKSIRK